MSTMSDKQSVVSRDQLTPGARAAKFASIAFIVGGLGVLGSVIAHQVDAVRFSFSYLFAFALASSVVLGALFFVLIQHLSAAGWSVTVRRVAELFAAGAPALLVLVLPLLVLQPNIYHWYGDHGDGHSPAGDVHGADHQGHASAKDASAHAGEDHGHDPEHALHEALLESKASYLNRTGFTIRAVVYVAFWAWLGVFLLRTSRRQDHDRDARTTARLQRLSAPLLIFFGLTLTFAAFDWLMALEPTWYSTIFGVYFFAGAAMAIHALLIVSTLSLKRFGFLGEAVNVEHYHDLGKLMFAFMCFWTYAAFSQLMLMWYASIPEELTYYALRWRGTKWSFLSMLLIGGHFAAPFILLMSRVVKRKLVFLGIGAAWLLVMHVADMYWFVMPHASAWQSVSWIDLVALMAVLGLYLGVVGLWAARTLLVPVGDPRLSRSLGFENL